MTPFRETGVTSAKTALCLAAAVAAAVARAFNPAGDPFLPVSAPTNETRVAVRMLGNNMPLVEAVVDGRPCSLIFDTGASHTTFDIGFVSRELAEAKLEDVVLAGVSNVEKTPKAFQVKSLKLGDAEFNAFAAMALDISHLSKGVGAKVDGIVGMNVIGRTRTLVALGGGEVVFAPGAERLDGFTVAARRRMDDPMTIAIRGRRDQTPIDMIVDSGSTFTFLGADTGWPIAEGEVAGFSAVDVNGGAGMAPKPGAEGDLFVGIPLKVRPMIVPDSAGDMNRIGSDVLRRYDMVVEPRRVAFRPHMNKEDVR